MDSRIIEYRNKAQDLKIEKLLAERTPQPSPNNLPTPCLIHNKGQGYGTVYYRGKVWHLHRLSFFLTVGEIPRGKNVLHLCAVKECSEPTHLYLGTKDNHPTNYVKDEMLANKLDQENFKLFEELNSNKTSK